MSMPGKPSAPEGGPSGRQSGLDGFGKPPGTSTKEMDKDKDLTFDRQPHRDPTPMEGKK